MLENTVWMQYNKENNFKEKLVESCVMAIREFINDEKELYAMMKAKLTKKELKLFAMDSGSIDDAKILQEFSYDAKGLEDARFKLYKKLKQDKTRLSFRATNKYD